MKTFLTESWGLDVPILGAPMSPQAGGALAAAISLAGGLGLIGTGAAQSPESILRDAEDFRAKAGDKKFGIGLMAWVLEKRPELLEAAIAAKPFVIAISFGDVAPFVKRVHAAGIVLAAQVQTRARAIDAENARVDLLVAQGTEAGGHTGSVGTLPLLQIVLDAVKKTPVVAAGGIATGRGLAAVLAAGAERAWIGTPFLVAEEARNTDKARAMLIAANETDTLLTSAFDAAQSIAWPPEFRGRALRNAFGERFDRRESAIDDDARREFKTAKDAEDYRIANLYAGESVALAKRVEPAAAILARIVTEAEERLRAVAAMSGRVTERR